MNLFEHIECCSADETYDFLKNSLVLMKEKLSEYWELIEETALITNLLDPRFKKDMFSTKPEKSKAMKLLERQYKIYQSTNDRPITGAQQSNLLSKQTNITPRTLTLTERIYKKKISSIINTDESELKKYLTEPCVAFSLKFDVLDWWKSKEIEYPILHLIARDFLTIMPTSVSSERQFTLAGLTVTDIRNQLHSNTAQELMCLKSWQREMETLT